MMSARQLTTKRMGLLLLLLSTFWSENLPADMTVIRVEYAFNVIIICYAKRNI